VSDQKSLHFVLIQIRQEPVQFAAELQAEGNFRNLPLEGESVAAPINGKLPPVDPRLNRREHRLDNTIASKPYSNDRDRSSVGSSVNLPVIPRKIGFRVGSSGSAVVPWTVRRSREKTWTTSLGYQDGYAAAFTFASSQGSRLGFKNQYMEDTLAALASSKSIKPGDKGAYRKDFMNGLAEGEREVEQAIARGATAADAQ
jgi:hypothetical protein